MQLGGVGRGWMRLGGFWISWLRLENVLLGLKLDGTKDSVYVRVVFTNAEVDVIPS